jgi:hypothetical protein
MLRLKSIGFVKNDLLLLVGSRFLMPAFFASATNNHIISVSFAEVLRLGSPLPLLGVFNPGC